MLFADISGFTALSERLARAGRSGAEVLVSTISGIFSPLLDVALSLGGDVLKFGGDALLIFFDGEGHVLRACAAADAMRKTLRRVGTVPVGNHSVTLRMSQGLHTGEFDFLMVGDEYQELLVVGPAVSTTLNMETAAKAQEVLVSERAAGELPGRLLGEARVGGRLLLASPSVTPSGVGVFEASRSLHHRYRSGDLRRHVPLLLRGRLDAMVGESEHRQATVAFLGFSGVDTLLAEVGAAEVHRRLQHLAITVEHQSNEFGVCVLGTDAAPDGGKFILAAGVPDAQEDADERLLRMAHVVLQADYGVNVRFGVNRGPLFCGAVGGRSRSTYSVMGDAMNLAARVMGRAGPGELLVTEAVLARCPDRFESLALEPFLVKGKSMPVHASVVGAPLGGARRRALDGGFVGRGAYLELFAHAAEQSRKGAGAVLEVVAEAGGGKSRLLREATSQMPEAGRITLQCDPYETSTPYSALRSFLLLAFETPSGERAEVLASYVCGLVSSQDPALEPFVPLLKDVLGSLQGLVESRALVVALTPRLRRQRLRELTIALARALLEVGTMIVIEDAHLMDEASADLLAPVMGAAGAQGWLVGITRRESASGLHAGRGYEAQVITLSPLSGTECRELVVLAHDDLPPHTVEQVVARSGGNPLFLLQLAEASAAGANIDDLPADIEAMVACRIDELAPADRRLLRYAAVLGGGFDGEALGEILGDLMAVTPTHRDWTRLEGFVSRGPAGHVRFHSELHRKVAYDALPFAARRLAHGRAGEALEAQPSDGHYELLSLHFHQAQRFGKSWAYSRAAADRARALYANLEAVELYSRAVEAQRHVASVDVTRQELAAVYEGLGDALEVTSQYTPASSAYARSRALVRDDPAHQARLMLKEGVVRERLGKYTAAIRWFLRGLSTLETAAPPSDGDGEVRAELLSYMAGVRFRQGRLEDCVSWAVKAAQAATEAGHLATQAHAWFLLDSALTDLGRPECHLYRDRPLPVYEQLGDLLGQAYVLNNLGINAYYEGDWGQALELYEKSRDVSVRAGDVVGAARAANNLGEILSDQGRTDEAETLFAGAKRVFRSVGYPTGAALALSNLGRNAARAGEYEQASNLLEQALEDFTKLGASVFVIETRARIAESALAAGEVEHAAALAGGALPGAAGAEASVARCVLERVLGLALVAQGDDDAGRDQILASMVSAEAAGAEFEVAVTLAVLSPVEERLGKGSGVERLARSRAVLARLQVTDLGCYRDYVPHWP